MHKFTLSAALLAGAAMLALTGCRSAQVARQPDTRVFETRIYYTHPGKLDDLHKRFREHTMALFEKHGMQNIGYWTPVDNTNSLLFYIIAHPSMEASAASWKAFGSDPEWKRVQKESELAGPIVRKVDRYFMRATDYSPRIKPAKSGTPRLFEWRDYTPSEGHLPALDARFRDHTIQLFSKHGIQHIGYWHTLTNKTTTERLVYMLAHKNKAAAEKSFAEFRKDPAWIAAKDASEKAAGGSLTAPNGVVSTFLVPTDYSPTK